MGKNMKFSHKQNEMAACANPNLLGKQQKHVLSACTVTGAQGRLALPRWT